MSIKITALSDLHGETPELPGGDLLIVAGDCTASGKEQQWYRFFDWLNKQQYRKKILVAGNHDNFLAENNEHLLKQVAEGESSYDYLCDTGTEFEGLKIWGSPWVQWHKFFHPEVRKFCVPTDEELAEKWALIPNDTDILITHGPPWGILDTNARGQPCGSKSMSMRLAQIDPQIHVFGHIHERGGMQEKNECTTFYNVSILDENYINVNKPTHIEI